MSLPGSAPSLTVKSCELPSRRTVTSTDLPGAMLPIMRASSFGEETSLPSTPVMTSPAVRPAALAGLSSCALETSTPVSFLMPSESAISGVTG